MQVRVAERLRLRRDRFGGVCYVPSRDDFFAVDQRVWDLVGGFSRQWTEVRPADKRSVSELARLEILETREPTVPPSAYSGPSYIGAFNDIVPVSEPLVVNCFATAFCPLSCKYCHADDLMKQFRNAERPGEVESAIATATAIPALVAVVTGGDPLTRPERAKLLIDALSRAKCVVLDTSGVGDFKALEDVVRQHNVHVRVSLDAISEVNDLVRPLNRAVVGKSWRAGSRESAIRVIKSCVRQGIPLSVQTVLSSQNARYDELIDLRDWLAESGVRHWVLHVCINAGSARKFNSLADRRQRPRRITPGAEVYPLIRLLMNDTLERGVGLDIRCTDTDGTPNSVLLVSSTGDLYTEGVALAGKNRILNGSELSSESVSSAWYHVDRFGHAKRYLNWTPGCYPGQNLRDLCYRVS